MPVMEIIFTYARLSYSPGSPAPAERWKRFQRFFCGVGVTLKRDILLKMTFGSGKWNVPGNSASLFTFRGWLNDPFKGC